MDIILIPLIGVMLGISLMMAQTSKVNKNKEVNFEVSLKAMRKDELIKVVLSKDEEDTRKKEAEALLKTKYKVVSIET